MIKIDVQVQNRVIEHFSFDKWDVTVGRDPACDVRIDNPLLSRKHARVFREEGRFYVEDLGSTNGVFLGGQKVQRAEVKDGDIFRIDKFAFHLKVAEPGAAPASEKEKKKEFAFDIMGTMQVDARALQEKLRSSPSPAAPVSGTGGTGGAGRASGTARVFLALGAGLAIGFVAGYLVRGILGL